MLSIAPLFTDRCIASKLRTFASISSNETGSVNLYNFDISARYQSPISLAVISATPSWPMT
jgi:hypothetical protein